MAKKINSFRDNKGKLFVACTECERGAYGSDADKCSAGFHHKKFNGAGCFAGTILEKFKELI